MVDRSGPGRRAWPGVLAGIVAAAVLCAASPARSQPAGTAAGVALDYRAPASVIVPDGETLLLVRLNDVREAHHLPPLSMSRVLRATARDHSRDMALSGFVGHDSSAGQSFLARLSTVVPAGDLVGENVIAASSVDEAHRAFMSSAGHLKNILDPAFHSVGIGIATAGAAGFMVTEDFAQ